MKDLKSLLQTVGEVEERTAAAEGVLQRAWETLDRILLIVHRDVPDFPSLLECQAQSRELRQVISEAPLRDLPYDARALADGTHPLSALLTFVERFEELDDKQWESLHEIVVRSFGKSVALSVLRRKLVFRSELSPQISATATVTSGARPVSVDSSELAGELSDAGQPVATLRLAVTEEGSTEPITATEEVKENGKNAPESVLTEPFAIEEEVRLPETATAGVSEVIQNETSTGTLLPSRQDEALGHPSDSWPVLSQAEPRSTIQVEMQPEKKREAEPFLSHFGLHDTAKQIAAAILNGPVEDRPLALRDLVWRLIYEDNSALAFHTACCTEALYPDLQPFLSSWLVRAVTVGSQVCHATGELANFLRDDLSQFSDEVFASGQHDWNHALRLLLAAATLRPALLAPGTNASRVLHALRMKEGLSQFWEYCEKIADYGNQQRALDPKAMKRVKDQAAWQDDVESLRQQVETWCAQAPLMTIVYAPATKVWRKWQESGGLIHSLLLPVRQKDLSRVDIVRRETERLSDDAEIKRAVHYTDRKVLRRPLVGDEITAKSLGQLYGRVREAVAFARRWIDLHEFSPSQRQDRGYLQRQAEQVRQEVWSRQKGVLEELQSFKKRHPSLFIVSGIAACLRAVENIRALFDPDGAPPPQEPFPKYFLCADFLRMPALSLNEEWEPQSSTQESVLDAILRLVADGRFSWQEAFDVQKESRNHEATARIIECLEVHPEVLLNLDDLRATREKHLRDCQTALQRDIEKTRKQVHDALALGLLRESEFRDYDSEIANMQVSLPAIVRFSDKHF